jgi:hypothetical protein
MVLFETVVSHDLCIHEHDTSSRQILGFLKYDSCQKSSFSPSNQRMKKYNPTKYP